MSDVTKKVQYLVEKNGRFYFRMRVPLPLVPILGKEVSQALGDISRAQAVVRVRALAAEHSERFLREQHRLGLAANPPVEAGPRFATLAEARALAQHAASSMLEADMDARIDGFRVETNDSGEFHLSRPLDAAIKAAIAGSDLSGVRTQAEDWLGAHGLQLPTDQIETRRMLMAWAMELAKARKGKQARDEGEPVETPQPPALPESLLPEALRSEKGKKMRDAFDAWKTSARRVDKTIKTFERHLEVFEKMSGDPMLSTFRRVDAVKFRDSLQQWAVEEGKTAATADNMLTTIKALVTIARDREWMEGNPFERLAVTKGGKDSVGRGPWTTDEMVTLFDAPLFKTYDLPSDEDAMGRKAGADAAYWVPLLAAYTGARPGELCSLWTDDLSEGQGGLIVEFRPDRERGKRLKTQKEDGGGSSWRAVPIHSELIRLGFREYWEAVKERAGSVPGPLFPDLQTDGENGPAGQFGQWFGEFKRERGFATPTKTLHSFRHTVETELAFAGVSPTIVDAITGHAGDGTGRKVYAATVRRQAERLRGEMERLQYPGLEMPKVYGVSLA